MKRKLAIVDANRKEAGGSDENNPKISEQDSINDKKVQPQVIVNVQSDNNITETTPQVPVIQPAE